MWPGLDICVQPGSLSQLRLPPCSLSPERGLPGGPPNRPPLNPCQAPDATLGGPASCGSGRAQTRLAPPTSHSLLWLPRQPQTASLCSQCGAPLKTSQCCKLYFYHEGGCGCTVFLRFLEKGKVRKECREAETFIFSLRMNLGLYICVHFFSA